MSQAKQAVSAMILTKKILLAVLVAAPVALHAADADAVASGASADLKKSLAELATLRQQVEGERVQLARQVNELEQKLISQRAELAKAQRFQENQLVELNALKGEAKRQSEETRYVESLLTEYARSFRSRISFIEEPRYKTVFDAAEKAASAPDLSPTAKFTQRFDLLRTALGRGEGALGGEIFEGKALDRQGLVQSGKVALVGPVAVFAGSSSTVAGLLQQELNKADPTVMAADRALVDAARSLVTTGSGQLPLDPTLGNAFKLAALQESLYERLAKGGLIMIPLLGLGVASLIIAALKWVQLSRIPLIAETELQKALQHLEAGHGQKALDVARAVPGMAGDLLATAIEHASEKKEYIEEVLYEKMLGARIRLERGIPFLALAATTGPLMGLLGTVMGMISTFKMISSFGSGDPKLLAAGISEALICTATGMAVAIPALLFHAFLSRKAKGIIGGMEKTAVGFVNGVPDQEKTFA